MANQIKYQVSFDVKQNDLNKLKASLQQLQKLKIGDIMKINDSDMATATSDLNRIKEQALNVEEALKKAFNTKLNTVNIDSFNQVLKQSGSSIEQVYSAFSRAGTSGENAFRSLSSHVLSTNIQLKETHGLLDKMAKTLTNTVKWNIASGAINNISRSVEQAWGYTKSLDTSLNNIRIVTGKSAEEMGNFAIKANEAAQSLGKTTTDYTNAALIYAQQGLSDKEIEERARITLMTANVTGQSTSDVSEELTAVWNGYKVNAEEAEVYIDRLAAVAATTASDLEELSTGMSKVASAAAAMGVGEDQLAAQLSTIISVTRQAPESVGTALRTVYARISDIKAGIDEDGVTLGNYSGKMAELGFNVLDAAGNLRDMGEVMEDIGNRWQDLTREQQISLAQTMAGQRQYSNLIALFDNFEKYNEALDTARNAAGTLQEQQDIYMESTAAHLQTLKAAVENIYDSLADTDSINGIVDGLTVAANVTANLVDSLGGGIGVLKALGSVGITVFSEQIAKGINTTITNLEIGQNNARQFDLALQATKDWQGIPGLDKVSQDLLKNREQLLELARLMTPEQFSGMQTLLNDITTLGNEIQEIQSKLDPLENTLKDFTDTSLMDVLGNEKEIDNIINKIDDPIDSLEKLQQKVKDTKEIFRDSFGEASALFGKSGVNTFDEVFDEAQVKITSFLDTLHDLKGTDAFKGLSDEAKAELDKIDTEWDELLSKLNTMAPEESSQAFKAFFDKLSKVASTSSDEIKRKYEELLGALNDPSVILSLEQKQQQLNKMINDFVTGQERMQRAAKIENYAKMAGGIAQVGSAIQQIQNLGSIWKNSDLSSGQKLLQTITNLAISLPMLANGFTKATTSLGLMQVIMGNQAKAAFATSAANATYAGSILGIKFAADKTNVSISLLNTTLNLSPFGAFLIAASAVVAALGAIANGFEEANRAAIQNNNETIEAAKAKQNQYEQNQKLYNSLQNLNQQYENGEITRSQLKASVENLVSQYNLEDNKIKELVASYSNLSSAIQKARSQAAQEQLQASIDRRKAAEDNIIRTARGEFWDNSYVFGKEYNSSFNTRTATTQEESSIRTKLFQEANAINTTISGGESVNFSVSTDMESMLQYYNLLKDIQKEYEELNPQIRNASDLYHQISDQIKKLNPVMKEYQESVKIEQQAGINNFINNTQGINLYETTFANDYVNQRRQIIDFIKQSYKDVEDVEGLADNYLRKNFGQLYSDFNGIANFVDRVDEKFKDKNILEIEQTLSQIKDYEHFNFLEDLKLDNISDWQDFENIIKYLSEVDLSNLKVVTNPQGQFEAATEQYNLYSSLSEQIADSKKQTINKKEYQTLQPEVQKYFERMANGQYKMTGDAEQFYNTVNNLSLDGFKKNIADLEASNDRLTKLQGVDFNQLSKSATTMGEDGSYSFQTNNLDQANLQLDFLTEMGYSLEQIVQWQAAINDGSATVNTLNEIADAVYNFRNQTDKLSTYLQANEDAIYQNELALGRSAQSLNQLKQYYDNDLIGIKAFTQAAIELDAALDIKNLDNKQLDNYAKHLQEIADQTEELDDELKDNEAAAKIVAKGIMKMNDAIEILSKNWKNWSDIIDNSSEISEEYAKAMGQAQQTVADLLDVSKDYISEDFIKQHLNDITDAATGSETAIDDLKSALAQNIVANIIIENKLDEQVKAQVLSDFADLQASIPDLQAGATLNDGEFLTKAQQFLQDCNATVDQANAIFDAIGFEANFATEQQKVTQRVPKTITKTQVVGYTSGTALGPNEGQIIPWEYPILQSHTYNDGYVEQEGTIDVPALATNGGVPKINKLTKKASGSSNNYSSSNSGGNSAGGKKGGGGGGGKGSKPNTSQKETKEALKDQVDLYHDINIEIGDLNRKLDNTQKKQDRLYGKDLIDNLNEQNDILDQQIGKLEQKYQLQKQDQTQKQSQLKELGVIFDGYGKIGNYMDILETKQDAINELIKQYNELIKQYNQITDEEKKKELNQQISELDKKIQHETQKMNNLKKGMDEYDKLMDAMQDNEDEREAKRQEKFEHEIQKFRTEIEIRLDMGEAERDWNNFRRNVLNHSNILKESDFDKLLKDTAQNYQDVLSYFDVQGQMGSLEALTNQLLATQDELDQINDGGESSIYGDNKKQAMEDLQNDLDELMQQMEDVEGLIDSIDKAYLDTIDDIMDQFDKQIKDYELIGDLIEHDIDLLSLLYGDRNYDAMDRYYTTLQNNNLKQLDSLKQQRDFWKEQWDAAVARGDSEAAKKFEEHYKETIGNLNSLIEESAENLRNKYLNAIDGIFDALDKKISGGLGTDYLSTNWQLMNKNADEYLDTINSAFAVQELEDKFQNAINDTKNLKNQQALKKLMDQQLDNLRAKEKLTEYDVERAEKLLQIEQARIALEDAQASKTSMRLKRDSQGNYSYEYVADQGNIGEAEQGLATAQNDLYNFDKDRYQSNLDDMLSAWKDFQEEYKEIVTDVSLSEEQRVANLALLRQQYGQYINDKTAENAVIRSNLMDSAFADIAAIYQTDVANYQQMADDEKNILMGDLVPAWQSGIQQMADKVAGEGGFIPVCQDAFEEITEATENYKDELDDMARVAGIDLNDVKQGVDDLSDSFSDLVEKNDDLLDRMNQQMDSIEQLKDAVHGLMEEYEDVYRAAKKAASAIHDTLQESKLDVFDDRDYDDDDDKTYAEQLTGKKYPTVFDFQKLKGPGQSNSNQNTILDDTPGYVSEDYLKGKTLYSHPFAEEEEIKQIEDFSSEWFDELERQGHIVTGTKKYTTNNGQTVNIPDNIWNLVPGGDSSNIEDILDWKKLFARLDTGGYTGDWSGNGGKLAVLHKKELVLNADDTENLFNTMSLLKSITDSLNGDLFARTSNIKSGIYNNLGDSEKFGQNVHIDASFPNVNSKKEIEEAFNDLVNLAAQRAMRR